MSSFMPFFGLRMLHTAEIWTLGPDAFLFAQKMNKITMIISYFINIKSITENCIIRKI